jgi:hypothetical protein
MSKTRSAGVTVVVAAAALVSVSSLQAHHSATMFDFAHPIRVKGTVVRYEAVNPHAFFALDVVGASGEVQRWNVEGPSLSRLSRLGLAADALRVGDVVEVCGFPPKEQWIGQYEGGYGPGAARVMHGHLLFRADGRMHLWGSYGKLINCVQEADGAERWADFLRSNTMARDTWCRTQGGIFGDETLPPEVLLSAIESALPEPCA